MLHSKWRITTRSTLMALMISVSFTGTILFPSLVALADQIEKDTTVLLTNNLLNLVKQYTRASSQDKSKLMTKIKDIISKRKAQLVMLLEKNPKAVSHLLLPQELTENFPAEIRELLEMPVELEGPIEVIIEDLINMTSKTSVTLTEPKSKKRFNLYFSDDDLHLTTDSVLKVAGVKIDNEVLVATNGSTVTSSDAPTYPLIGGDQKTLVILVNFLDAATSCSAQTMQNVTFGTTGTTANTTLKESSFNNLNLSGDVVGPFTINYSQSTSNPCNDHYLIANLVDDAATKNGIILSNYQRKVYSLPNMSCSWAGRGTIGGNPSKTWLAGPYCSYPTVVAHELGHNLGMNHASSVSAGTISEYGDRSDIMGSTYVGSFPYSGFQHNAPHKLSMGWIPAERSLSVTSDGTYTIDSVENANSVNPQMLKIHKADTNVDYYISFRQPIGFDAGLEYPYNLKTNIHTWNGYGNTYFVGSVDDGGTFTDTINAITIRQLSHTASQATIAVSIGTPACNRVNPVVSLSPLSNTASKGATLNYSVSITNRNGTTCPASTYLLTSLIPAGWSSTFSSSTISLNSGASGSATWMLTSSSQATDGTYPVSVTVKDSADPIFGGSQEATYVVFTDLAAPNVAVTSPANGGTVSGKVNIAVSANDNIGVQKVEIYVDGALKATDTSSPYSYSWNTTNAGAGTHTIYAKAYDRSNNSSMSSVVSVTLNSTKGGKPR